MLGIGWWYWSLNEASARVDREIAAAQQRSRPGCGRCSTEVQQFEARRGAAQQRVQLIEQLRGGQSVPVQLLDHVSRSLPDMLWLTSMAQNGPELTIQGRSTTLIALSDFVGNLGTNPLLMKPIEIVEQPGGARRARAQARSRPAPAVEIDPVHGEGADGRRRRRSRRAAAARRPRRATRT